MRAPVRVAVVMLARSPSAPAKPGLTAGLGETAAVALRRAILHDSIDAALAPAWPLHLFVAPAADAAAVRDALGADPGLASHAADVHVHPQGEGDPALRIGDAVARTLRAGHDVVVLVASDVPDLPPNALRAAAQAVSANPGQGALAIGPAADGGVYLLATTDAGTLRTACAGMTWGHADVASGIAARARAALVPTHRVTSWHDVDTAQDLADLCRRAAVTGRARRTREVVDAPPRGPATIDV